MDPLEFGGRRFEVMVSRTVEADIVLSNLLDAAGMEEAIFDNIEQPEDKVNAAIANGLARSGKLFQIIGAAVVPEGTPPLSWSPKLQAETAAFFASLPSEGNTRRVLVAAVSLVRAFFLVELLFTQTSRKSSQAPATDPGSRNGANGATSSSAPGQ